MKKGKLYTGDFVKSHFRSRWVGVILDGNLQHPYSTSVLCLIIIDGAGNKPRKRILKRLSPFWLTKVKPVNIKSYNTDWFVLTNVEF